MTDARAQYDFWSRRLAGEVIPINDGNCQAGFYRLDRKGAEPLAIAYWFDKSGALRCRIGKDDVTEGVAMERWPWASKHPISHETYRVVIAGEPWPDVNAAVTRSNNAPQDGSYDAYLAMVEDLEREAKALIAKGAATTQDEADSAADLANRLAKAGKEGKEFCKADPEITPELRAATVKAAELSGRWAPVINRTSIYAQVKALVLTPFLIAQKAAADAAKAKAIAIGKPPEAVAQPRTVAGSQGRSVGLRTVTVAVIENYAACLASFADHPDIKEVVQKLADRAAKAGIPAPGTKIHTTEKAA